MAYSFQRHRIPGGIAADDGYWQALEDGAFRIPRCSGCSMWVWPAHYRCGTCGSWDMEWTDVAPVGRVFSWTRSWYAFEGVIERAEDVPYVTILAEIPAAGGARVLGMLTGDEAGLRIGAPVRGIIRPPTAKSKFHASIEWMIDRGGPL